MSVPRLFTAAVALLLVPTLALPHGSVTNEDDLCAIRIGYFRAHFKIYLPESRGHEQFCEDLPATGDSVFVMEYIHPGLGRIPVDFRIIRDVTGMGRFARAEDVAAITDIDSATVLYRPASVTPDVFTIGHRFDEAGDYIGIVTARPEAGAEVYTAVFPFRVGFTGFGYWPAIAALIVLLQVNYLYMSGRFPFRKRPRISAVTPRAGASGGTAR